MVMLKKYLLIGTGILFLLLVITAGKQAYSQHAKQKSFKTVPASFVEDALVNRCNDAYILYSQSARKDTSSSDWQSTCSSLATFFKGNNPQLVSTKQANVSNGTTIYKIAGPDGDYLLTLAMTYEKGTWRIQSFNSQLQTN